MVAVAMLVGFSAVMASVLYTVLSGHAGTVSGSASCMLSAVSLYEIGPGRAYLAASVSNTGTQTIQEASVSLVDGAGVTHRVDTNGTPPLLHPGETWRARGAFDAQVNGPPTGGAGLAGSYLIRAEASTPDGSAIQC